MDGKYWTAWAPDPGVSGNARLRFVFEKKVAVAGVRIGDSFQRVDPVEGILHAAFG